MDQKNNNANNVGTNNNVCNNSNVGVNYNCNNNFANLHSLYSNPSNMTFNMRNQGQEFQQANSSPNNRCFKYD